MPTTARTSDCHGACPKHRTAAAAITLNVVAEADTRTAAVCAIRRSQVPLDELVVPEMMDCLTWLLGLDCYALAMGDAVIAYPMLWPLIGSAEATPAVLSSLHLSSEQVASGQHRLRAL